jgi:hypothetical protein
MMPDFPEFKSKLRSLLLRAMKKRVLVHEPLLAGIGRSCVHEGSAATLTRGDESTSEVDFTSTTAELSIPADQMRRITFEELMAHIDRMAAQFAEQQTTMLFQAIKRATDEVGNTVSAAELGQKEAFVELYRKIEMEFDPDTLEPTNMRIVMGRHEAEQFLASATNWECDPEFIAEMDALKQKKIEEWRAREDRRKLVD